MMPSVRVVFAAASLVAVTSVWYACGSDDGSTFGPGGTVFEEDSGIEGGEAPDTGPAFEVDAGEGGLLVDGGPDTGCLAPVDMFIMFDRSTSMNAPLPGTDRTANCDGGKTTAPDGSAMVTRWCSSIGALSGYFRSGPAGVEEEKKPGAAIQFFPQEDASAAACSAGEGYHVAASPPTTYTRLPSTSFDALLNSTMRVNSTPTEGALRGIMRFTDNPANRIGGHVTIGILITDGNPSACAITDPVQLAGLLAGDAGDSGSARRVYVIGMTGATFSSLETIAAGGGAPLHPSNYPLPDGGVLLNTCGAGAMDDAGMCRHWNVADGDPAVFIAALAAIQEQSDGCKPGGGTVNPK